MASKRIVVIIAVTTLIAALIPATQNAAAWESIDEVLIVERTEDPDEDGKANFLAIDVPVNDINWLGYPYPDFRDYLLIEAELWNGDMTEYITYDVVEFDVEEGAYLESAVIPLAFSGRAINASGVDGPYLVMIVLTHIVEFTEFSGFTLIAEQTDWADYTTTGEYSSDDFEGTDPFSINAVSVEFVDEDDNGLHDWVRATLDVNVSNPELATFELMLEPEYGSSAVVVYEEEHLILIGDGQEFVLDIDARFINGFGLDDTRYAIHAAVSTADGYSVGEWVMTDPVDASDFEDYVVAVEGEITCDEVDVNEDGLTDFFRIAYNVTVMNTDQYTLQTDILDRYGYAVGDPLVFDGYLIEGYEETVVLMLDAYPIYELGLDGALDIEVYELPLTHSKWQGYVEVSGLMLGTSTSEEFEHDELNHPEYVAVSGFVTDQYGEPVPDAEVIVRSENFTWQWAESYWGSTGSDGSYTASGMVPGDIVVSVEAAGYLPGAEFVEGATEDIMDVNLTLVEETERTSSISGTTLDSEGAPLADVILLLMNFNPISPLVEVLDYAMSNATGEYSFDVTEGKYIIIAELIDIANVTGINYNVTLGAARVMIGEYEDLTVDITVDFEFYVGANLYDVHTEAVSLSFDDWENGAMDLSYVFPEVSSSYWQAELWLTDLMYGDGDEYIDESEMEDFEELLWTLAVYYGLGTTQAVVQSGLYFLDSFCVDGIGYSSPTAWEIPCSVSGATGSVWQSKDDVGVTLTFDPIQSYWPIPQDEVHRLYIEVEYSGSVEATVFDIEPPTGYVLSSTNSPENVTVEGVSHVTVTSGLSPDPESIENALLMLEFESLTSDGTGSIQGTATLQGEDDHSGIAVDLLDQNLTLISSVTTASTGEYYFADLEPGEYHVRASMTGYYDAYGSASVEADAAEDVDLVLISAGTSIGYGSIAGRVLSEDDSPLYNATVEIFTPADSDTAFDVATTGTGGALSFTDLEPGEYRLEVSAEGFHEETVYVLLNPGEDRDIGDVILLSAAPTGYITGSVEDTDGNPVAEVTVEVRLAGSDTLLGADDTGPDGTFRIDGLEDGEYDLTFVLDGDIVAYADVTVENSVGDAGTVVIEIEEEDIETEGDDSAWMFALLAGIIIAVAAAIVVLMRRRPGSPQPTDMKLEDVGAPAEDVPPLA